MYLFFLWLFFVQAADVPLKAKEEFSVNVDLQFKAKPANAGNARITINEINSRPQGSMSGTKATYLRLKISLLKLSPEEIKARVTNEEKTIVYNKKVKDGSVIILDVGFMDELKERPVDTVFDCVLLSDKKQPVSKIQILIDRSGTYFVNGTKFGKF